MFDILSRKVWLGRVEIGNFLKFLSIGLIENALANTMEHHGIFHPGRYLFIKLITL